MSDTKKLEGNNKPSNEFSNISKFVNAIFTKNYALANKYLTGVVQEKIKSKIETNLNKPLF